MSHLQHVVPQEGYDDDEFAANQTYQAYEEEPPPPSAVHQCNVCNKIFVSFKGLQQHAVIHTDSKPFICEICGRGFRFKSNMFEHRTVHTGYTPHLCPFCGKSFRLKGNMKKHMRVHVTSKEELEEAYRPYSSNRRPCSGVPENAIVIRGCATPYYTPLKPRSFKKLQLGSTSAKWVSMICRNELLPCSSISEKKCVRSFTDEEIFRQHQSYHSRVELMTRNREIECLTECPEVPIDLICYDLLNGTNQVISSQCGQMPPSANCANQQNDMIPEQKHIDTMRYHQENLGENNNMIMVQSDNILADMFALTDTKPMMGGCSAEGQLANPNDISLTFMKTEPNTNEMDTDDFGGNPNQMLSTVKQMTYNDEIGENVI